MDRLEFSTGTVYAPQAAEDFGHASSTAADGLFAAKHAAKPTALSFDAAAPATSAAFGTSAVTVSRWLLVLAMGMAIPSEVLQVDPTPELVSASKTGLGYAIECSDQAAEALSRLFGGAEFRSRSPHQAWLAPLEPQIKMAAGVAGELKRRAETPDNPVEIRRPLHLSAMLFASAATKPTSDSEAVVRRWEEELRAAGVDATISIGGYRDVLAKPLRTEDSQAVATFLAEQSEVVWVDQDRQYELFNDAAVPALRWGSTSVPNNGDYPPLDGEGQIISIGDSGLHTSSCYFEDPDHNVPYMSTIAARSDTGSSQHRKIAAYVTHCADGDTSDLEGHGTHVCGSAAGDADLPEDGAAPEARIYFMDIDNAESEFLDCIPSNGGQGNFYDDYLLTPHNAGARIHSSSWGSGFATFSTSRAYYLDAFVWFNPESLVLFSAGNMGPGTASLGDPSGAKNVLAVGASAPSWGVADLDLISVGDGAFEDSLLLDYQFAAFGPFANVLRSGSGVAKLQLRLVDPADACSAPLTLSPSTPLESGLPLALLVEPSNCDVVNITRFAQEAGASLVLVYTDGPGVSYMATPDWYNVTVEPPLTAAPGSISERQGLWLREQIQLKQMYAYVSRSDLAYFSSRGFAYDGRTKPDLLAPGWQVSSAEVGESCDATDKWGTSMACPLLAGTAARLRQYLVEGRHPTGKINPDHAISNPSAALLRAILVASATDTWPSNVDRGWGMPSLHRALPASPLANPADLPADSSKGLLLYDEKGGLSHGGHFTVRIRALEPDAVVVAVLTWIDPPILPTFSKAVLNNLDLALLTTPPVYGNGFVDMVNTFPDDLNNCESVLAKLANGEEADVRVDATLVIDQGDPYGNKQAFALAIRGAVEVVSESSVGFTATAAPTSSPSPAPTSAPSAAPSVGPTLAPSAGPTSAPSSAPTFMPSSAPTNTPSTTPTSAPSSGPTAAPSSSPTAIPSTMPTASPSSKPTATPSSAPSSAPSSDPTSAPSSGPTATPSSAPTVSPSATPTTSPSATPTASPSSKPTATPSSAPSSDPSSGPTSAPSSGPAATPSSAPTASPSATPSSVPSSTPTYSPSATPTSTPSSGPTSTPSSGPSSAPSSTPTVSPSIAPSTAPSSGPTSSPPSSPTAAPSSAPVPTNALLRVSFNVILLGEA